MKKIIFVLVAFFALTTSANASVDPFANIQFSILQPYYLSFTGTFNGTQDNGTWGSIDILGDTGNYWDHFQKNLFSTNDETIYGWYTDINTGFDLEQYINNGYTDFVVIFDGVVGFDSTIVRELHIHIGENKNITYNWVIGS